MIARYDNCTHTWACSCSTAMTISSTANVSSNQIDTTVTTYRSHLDNLGRSARELERELRRFERAARERRRQPSAVKVDEKRLIAKPTRAHVKPHQAPSSRAAMSVWQFASRVK